MPAEPPPPPAVSVAPEKPPEPEPAGATSAGAVEPAAAPAPVAPKVVASPHTGAAAAPSASGSATSKGPGPLGACCAALSEASKKGGLSQNQYTAAATICAGLDKQIKAGTANLTSAKVTLKAQLAGVTIPGSCN